MYILCIYICMHGVYHLQTIGEKRRNILILKLLFRQYAVHDLLYNLHPGRTCFHFHHHRASEVNIYYLEGSMDDGVLRNMHFLVKFAVRIQFICLFYPIKCSISIQTLNLIQDNSITHRQRQL